MLLPPPLVLQLKERLQHELEEAVEKERAAAGGRLREASERYEQQAQAQRMRLVATADLKLEQLEQARWAGGRQHTITCILLQWALAQFIITRD